MPLLGGFSYAPMGWTWDAPKFLYHASMVCLHDLLRGVSIQIHGIIVFRQILVKLIYKHLITSFYWIIYAAKPLKGLLQIAAELRIWISPLWGVGRSPTGIFRRNSLNILPLCFAPPLIIKNAPIQKITFAQPISGQENTEICLCFVHLLSAIIVSVLWVFCLSIHTCPQWPCAAGIQPIDSYNTAPVKRTFPVCR